MGCSYTSALVVGADLDHVAAATARPAYLATDGRVVAVYAEDDELGDIRSDRLSVALGCAVITFGVYESDLLIVRASANGELVLEACAPDPEQLFAGDSSPDFLAALLDGDRAAAGAALRDDYARAEDRHSAFLTALGLPTWSAGVGYRLLATSDAAYRGPEPVLLV